MQCSYKDKSEDRAGEWTIQEQVSMSFQRNMSNPTLCL